MNVRLKTIVTVMALALVLPVFAVAANKNSGKFDVPNRVQFQGKQLDPGTYKVEWNGNGPNVNVSILKGRKTIAEAPARLLDQSFFSPAIVTHQNKDGKNVLDQIQLKNKEIDLRARASRPESSGTTSGS